MKKKVVFLTGAGMSVESGFKTFRGNDGLWENYPVEQVASHDGWLANPTLVTNFYNQMRRKLWDAQPCEGHRLIAEMERDYDVTVLTQNVDNLHEKAGSTHVIHLHGELSKVCSSNDPYDERYIRELKPGDPDIVPGTKAGDGSLLRPFIVFFGESVPMLNPAAEEAAQAAADECEAESRPETSPSDSASDRDTAAPARRATQKKRGANLYAARTP